MRRIVAALAVLFLLAAAPARAEWRRAESPNFVLYGNTSESNLRQRILLLEDFDRLLRMLASAGDRPSPKLHVYLVSGIDDIRIVRPVADGIAGFYVATDEGIAALVDGRAEGRGNEILFHEYTHHFMRQHMRVAYPAWFVEGFAEYFATVRFSERRIDIGDYSRGRAWSVLEGPWLPMERILSGGTGGLSREAASAYYAQSWLLVHYFYSNPQRLQAMSRLLRALRTNRDAAAALQQATGLTPEGLTQEMRRYIRGRQIAYRQSPRASAESPPPVTVTAMPPGTGDLILYEAALRVGIIDENRQPHLQRIRAAAARWPGDPFATRVLAHAELLHGDAAAADRLLDDLLAREPGDADLLYLKGRRFLLAARSDDPPEGARASARQWLARARAADPTHFQALIRYVEALDSEADFASQETVDLLMQASELAPQIASVALQAARLLIRRGELDRAVQLLAPLAVNPHDAALARAATELILRARSERGGLPPDDAVEEDGEAPPEVKGQQPLP